MVRICLFVLLLPGFLSSYAQDTLNVTDSRGQKHGFWRKVDTAGRIVYEGRFIHGKPDGDFRYFYPDGKLKMASAISAGGKRALTVSYFPSGKKMAEGRYLNEQRDSVWLFYGENTGALASREPYREGKIDGMARIYFPDGTLSEQQYYRMGVKDGLWEQYYSDGKLRLRSAFKAGEKSGAVKTFYNSGEVMMEGKYLQGHPEGEWTYYDPNGSVRKKEFYQKGILLKTEPEQ